VLLFLAYYLSWCTIFIGETQKPLEKDAGEKTITWLDKLRNSNGSVPTSKIRLNMQHIMQNNAAVFRTQETLAEGMQTPSV
jgi:succinate dehydrogenase (ubiquinone) flavoprotein subunit